MKRKSFTITLMALLALFLSVGGVTGQGPDLEPQGEVRPQGDISVAATVNSLISYQGRLTEDGSPVTGERDMTFRLYSDSSCSTQVGGDIVNNDVSVEDGLFSVKLNVNQGHFNGQGLWLGVDVGNTGTNIICEEILPVPYALSLRPGAVISGTATTELTVRTGASDVIGEGAYGAELAKFLLLGGAGVYGYSHTAGYGVCGKSDHSSGSGVYGHASASSGANEGVYGQSDSTGGRGVYGRASASSGTTYGVYGRSDSASGAGVYGFSSSGTGVHAYSNGGVGVHAISGSDTAVWAETSGGFAAVDGRNTTGTGVHAYSNGGVGVHAISDSDTAVWAETSGGFAAVDGRNTTGTGVYASSDSGYGVHAYSKGGVGVRAISDSDTAVWAETSGGYAAVDGRNTTGYGVHGRSDSGYGGYFRGYNGVYAVATGANGVALMARGNVRILNSSNATIIELGEGLDYAEGFDVSDEAEIGPGAVLVIDPDHPGELRMSDTPYDRKVAGIVAGAQGMGSAVRLAPGQFDYDVALAGRVYCNVDATEVGVEPGDLLTTSATPGYAMKVTDYARAQGAILGKAMEGLEKGEKGQILVLVTLQ